MSAELSPLYCHKIIDRMEHDFLENDQLHIVVHLDPIAPHNALRDLVETCLKAYDIRLSLHDFDTQYRNDKFIVTFDCVLPEDLVGRNDEITSFVTKRVQTDYPNSELFITFDSNFAALPHSTPEEK
jgi:hypothetical protein